MIKRNKKMLQKYIFSSFIVSGLALFISNQAFGMEDQPAKEPRAKRIRIANPVEVSEDVFRMCAQPLTPPKDFGTASGHRLEMLRTESSKWLNGTQLLYHFLVDGGANEIQKTAVRKAFAEWKSLGIGLSFEETIDPSKAQIKIGFDYKDGSWSYIGRDALKYASKSTDKSMNFGWDLTTPYGHITALHEIGHSLGFPHEHQSPFAGIKWNVKAVYDYFQGPPNNWDKAKIDHNILTQLNSSEVRGTDWDPDSVMHYSFKSGLISKPKKYLTQDLIPPYQLSQKDISQVRDFYPPVPHFVGRSLLELSKPVLLNLASGQQIDFSIIPTKTRAYTIETHGPMDVVMVLFNKTDNMSYIKENDNSGKDTVNTKIVSPLTKGKEYVLKLRLNYTNQVGVSGSVTIS